MKLKKKNAMLISATTATALCAVVTTLSGNLAFAAFKMPNMTTVFKIMVQVFGLGPAAYGLIPLMVGFVKWIVGKVKDEPTESAKGNGSIGNGILGSAATILIEANAESIASALNSAVQSLAS